MPAHIIVSSEFVRSTTPNLEDLLGGELQLHLAAETGKRIDERFRGFIYLSSLAYQHRDSSWW